MCVRARIRLSGRSAECMKLTLPILNEEQQEGSACSMKPEIWPCNLARPHFAAMHRSTTRNLDDCTAASLAATLAPASLAAALADFALAPQQLAPLLPLVLLHLGASLTLDAVRPQPIRTLLYVPLRAAKHLCHAHHLMAAS
jgi:hypothetical protein